MKLPARALENFSAFHKWLMEYADSYYEAKQDELIWQVVTRIVSIERGHGKKMSPSMVFNMEIEQLSVYYAMFKTEQEE